MKTTSVLLQLLLLSPAASAAATAVASSASTVYGTGTTATARTPAFTVCLARPLVGETVRLCQLVSSRMPLADSSCYSKDMTEKKMTINEAAGFAAM